MNFVSLKTFLNQRHGFHHLQPKIASKEFDCLLTELRDMNENTDILTLWYQQDLNCSPPENVIQPISAHIPEYREKVLLHAICFHFIFIFKLLNKIK